MPTKVRIYQLAKDLGVESKELLAILDDMGVEYKSHSSTLDADTAATVRDLVEADRGGEATEAGEAAAGAAAPDPRGSSLHRRDLAVRPDPAGSRRLPHGRRSRRAFGPGHRLPA